VTVNQFVSCILTTNFIQALRAEGIQYVVAPYEADAQLAYLERVGLVDGIITEDSDLLVFGCKTVLFKLDAVSSTVACISRSDFASLTTSESGISLLGWSDVQFRAMAILSGCDYLPSIAGIGLKTAWSLLRKHKTVEHVLRMLRFEGKKEVPKQYLLAFKLAEKVFLHQRVYDPATERLVNMTPIPEGDVWDEETETYVGM
jgi:exonuclease 1